METPVETNIPEISTHALTWRATLLYRMVVGRIDNFYPRPHMEGDVRTKAGQRMGRQNFYPRPHMEGDTPLLSGN